MGILDDIKKQEIDEYLNRMNTAHPVEDDIIERYVDLLEKRILKRDYRFDGAYDLDEYYIKAFLAYVTYRDGKSGYQLMDEQWGWQEGQYNLNPYKDIVHIDTHPFKKIDSEYIKINLPVKIKEKIGGGCGIRECSCIELYRVEKRFFRKFNDIVRLGKYSVYAEIRWK